MNRIILIVASIVSASLCHAGEVSRSNFTTGIEQKEPVDSVEQLTTDYSKVMYFSELTGMNGERAIHRWMHNDEILAEIAFEIGSDRWRVWSSKNLVPEWQGPWTVEVVDGEGNVIGSNTFTYGNE